jgi:hypothetical protein
MGRDWCSADAVLGSLPWDCESWRRKENKYKYHHHKISYYYYITTYKHNKSHTLENTNCNLQAIINNTTHKHIKLKKVVQG